MTAKSFLPANKTPAQVSNFTFFLYLLYIISFFLHLAARLPAIAVIRPDMLIALTLLALLFMQQPKLAGKWDNACNRYLLIFLAYSIVSLPFVEWPGSVLRVNLVEVIKAFLFFYFTVLIVDSDVRLKRFIFVFMACQLIRVLEPLYLHLAYGYWGSQTYLGGGEFAARLGGAPSDVINPNGLALVIATVFPFLHYLWGNSGWTRKLAYVALVPPLLYALVLTMSRSGMVAMLVIATSILHRSRHKLVLITAGGMIAVLAWSSMSDVQRDRYLSMTGADDTKGAATFDSRLSGIQSEFRVALNKPLFGHGLGTSKEALFNIHGGTHMAHNLYSETFIEAGFIGLIIYILFLKSIHRTLKQAERNIKARDIPVDPPPARNKKNGRQPVVVDMNEYERNLIRALTACFWMFMIFSVAQYGLREYHWYFLAGVATVLERLTRSRTENINVMSAYQEVPSAGVATTSTFRSKTSEGHAG